MNIMNFRFTILLTGLATFVGLPEAVNGLKCNACIVTKDIKPNCEVLSCDSLEDVKKSMKSHSRQSGKARAEEDGLDPNESRYKNATFVCIRTVAKLTGENSSPFITSGCTAALPKFPPSDKPYSAATYSIAELDASQIDPKTKEVVKTTLKNLEGQVYFCDEKVGQGPNCGEKSSTDLESVKI